jgi:molybdopterin-guanine dinucleotide biosynthesis protein
MAVIVISGSGRAVGKTSIGCALIASLTELRWLAIKVTPHFHGAPERLWEELDRNSSKDTGRYLTAGARRSFLVSGSDDFRATDLAIDARAHAEDCNAVLVESNRILPADLALFGEPTLSLAVLAGDPGNWKPSLARRVKSVDAVVVTQGFNYDSEDYKQTFSLAGAQWSSPELVEFARSRVILANS